MNIAIGAASPPSTVSFTVALLCFFRAFGETLGVAIGGVIFQNQLKTKLMDNPLLAENAERWSQQATALVAVITAMEDGDVKTHLVQAYSDSLRMIWVVMAVLAAIAGLTSLGVKGYSMLQVNETGQGLVCKEKNNTLKKQECGRGNSSGSESDREGNFGVEADPWVRLEILGKAEL